MSFTFSNDIDLPKTTLDQEKYCKELEALMRERRKVANTPIDPAKPPKKIPWPVGVGLTHPITDKTKLYEDRQKRLKERTCSRCGVYFKYHVEKKVTPIKPHEIDPKSEEVFWAETFEIVKETIPNPGTLDDDFYDVCKSCQSDILHNTKNYVKHINLHETRQELIGLEEDEQIRYQNQLKRILKLQEKYKEHKKQDQQDRLEAAIVRDEQRKEREQEERNKSKSYTPRPRQNLFSSQFKSISPTLGREAKDNEQ